MSEWISCKERLPRLGQLVLATLSDRKTTAHVVKIVYRDDDAPVHPWWWEQLSGETYEAADISHWMPLPEPPTLAPGAE